MEKILNGIAEFRRDIFPERKEDFERLANKQQKPQALFITCSDSRVSPNLITMTDPGDLFLIRNAGNIIPPYGAGSGGEAATIEYALSVLGIKNVIVCGHSRCGAMHALQKAEHHAHLPAVSAWFSHAEATRRIALTSPPGLTDLERETFVVEQNVLVQLQNLRTHPSVMAGVSSGELKLYGWFYRIETGEVLGYSQESGEFIPLTSTESHVASTPSPQCAVRERHYVA